MPDELKRHKEQARKFTEDALRAIEEGLAPLRAELDREDLMPAEFNAALTRYLSAYAMALEHVMRAVGVKEEKVEEAHRRNQRALAAFQAEIRLIDHWYNLRLCSGAWMRQPGGRRAPRSRRSRSTQRARSPGRSRSSDSDDLDPARLCPRCGHCWVPVGLQRFCVHCWADTVLELENRRAA